MAREDDNTSRGLMETREKHTARKSSVVVGEMVVVGETHELEGGYIEKKAVIIFFRFFMFGRN